MIDSDTRFFRKQVLAYAKKNIILDRVGSIQETLICLLNPNDDYHYSGIELNADTITLNPLLRVLRTSTDLPIFVTTSKYPPDNFGLVIEMGADYYQSWLKKPELNAERILALIHRFRKRSGSIQADAIITCGDIMLLPKRREVYKGDSQIVLSKSEFDILHVLIEKCDHTVSYQHLCRLVLNEEYYEEGKNTLYVLVNHIRKKLNLTGPSICRIQNIKDIGYRFTYVPNAK